jgi:8-oxo-dGTP pyrophosphatase MutT (NUDIX family)
MSIWIDQPMWPRHGTVFAHLVSDVSFDELHAFARRVDLHPRAYHGDHYDVPQERYAEVVAAGATSTTGADVVRRLLTSGLRLRKRQGDRPVTRIPALVFPDGTRAAVDLLVSDRLVTTPGVFAAMVFIQDADGRFAVVHSPRRDAWGSPGGWCEPGETALEAAVREVREETGLVLDPGHLQVCAYERFEVDGEVRGRWPSGRSYLQVFRTRLSEPAPELTATEDDVDDGRWVDRTAFEALCGADFWWPLVPPLFDGPPFVGAMS